MTVNELIDLLQNIEDKEKPVLFNDYKIPDSYGAVTTVRNTKNFVLLDQIAWLDGKNHYIKGEIEND